MSFFDFLKSIFPDALVKINIDRKIIIKDSEIIIGDKKINDVKAINQFYQELSRLKKTETYPFQLLHEDLAKEFLAYEHLSIHGQSTLKLLKEVLPQDEIECVLMARRVHWAFQKKETTLANKLLSELEKDHPKHGKKVFNLIAAGYFDEMILPLIEVFKSKYGAKHIQEFQDFYFNLLRFFPVAIFVGNTTTEGKLKEELQKRCQLKDIPFIRIHAIGEANMQKVDNAIRGMDLEDKYEIAHDPFTTAAGIKGMHYEIRLQERRQ